MKNKTIILVIVLATAIALAYILPHKEEVKEGRNIAPSRKTAAVGFPAPEFELKDINGKIWRLAELKGKVVLINFWATWCDSCKEENPSLWKFIDSEKDNSNFVAVSILYNDSGKNAAAYLNGTKFRFNVLIDDGKTSSDYGITGVPETFVISKKGILQNKIVGPINWDTPDVSAAIRKLTEES